MGAIVGDGRRWVPYTARTWKSRTAPHAPSSCQGLALGLALGCPVRLLRQAETGATGSMVSFVRPGQGIAYVATPSLVMPGPSPGIHELRGVAPWHEGVCVATAETLHPEADAMCGKMIVPSPAIPGSAA